LGGSLQIKLQARRLYLPRELQAEYIWCGLKYVAAPQYPEHGFRKREDFFEASRVHLGMLVVVIFCPLVCSAKVFNVVGMRFWMMRPALLLEKVLYIRNMISARKR
jgi:hypothetical protein